MSEKRDTIDKKKAGERMREQIKRRDQQKGGRLKPYRVFT